jgi:purine-binding chemotaxis protein CheW
MSAEYQLCTLYVDTLFCGIDVNKVQEALSPQPLTRVPLASRVVRGLINLRGQVIAAIDLRACLERPPCASHADCVPIIVREGDDVMALLVDRVGEVLTVSDATFEPPTLPIEGEAAGLISGVHKLPGRILHVLEILSLAHLVIDLRDASPK